MTMVVQQKRSKEESDHQIEKARVTLMAGLETLRRGTLSDKEADAVAAAIEDELIALRVSLVPGRLVTPRNAEPNRMRSRFCRLKAEKVVKPPQIPTIRKIRTFGCQSSRSGVRVGARK